MYARKEKKTKDLNDLPFPFPGVMSGGLFFNEEDVPLGIRVIWDVMKKSSVVMICMGPYCTTIFSLDGLDWTGLDWTRTGLCSVSKGQHAKQFL
jgi:hypothetical protein